MRRVDTLLCVLFLTAYLAVPAGCDSATTSGGDGGACICAAECERLEGSVGGELFCGGRDSIVNAEGCERAACTASSQCGEGERCYPVGLAVGSTVDDPFRGCGPNGSSVNELIAHQLPMEGRCVDAVQFPAAGDCPVPTTCSAIWDYADLIDAYGLDPGSLERGGRLEGEALDIVLGCIDRLGQAGVELDCAFPQWPPSR